MSRCAPASDAPTMARGSRHTSTRFSQLASVWPVSMLAMTVLRSSSIAMSTNASHGSLLSSVAMAPIDSPSKRFQFSLKVSSNVYVPQLANERSGSGADCARRFISARPAGSRSIASLVAGSSAMSLSQPGKMSSTKPLRRFRRRRNVSGNVSAKTRPPLASAMSPPVS